MGRVINLWSCGPVTCGTSNQNNRPLSFTYDWAGNLTGESDTVSGTIAYTRSVAGEVTSITNQTYQNLPQNPPNLVSNVVNGPDGPVSYKLGNSLNVYQGYDTLGRLNGRWVCNGPAAMYCSGGTQVYGSSATWKGAQELNQSDTILNQQVTFGYDGFNRLTSRTVTSGTVQNYTYSYDRYGNRVSQTPQQTGYSFNPTINAANNQITTSGFTYDAAGNMTSDSVHAYTYDAEGNITKVNEATRRNTSTTCSTAGSMCRRRVRRPNSPTIMQAGGYRAGIRPAIPAMRGGFTGMVNWWPTVPTRGLRTLTMRTRWGRSGYGPTTRVRRHRRTCRCRGAMDTVRR
jgi:YD repeat-containing protein